MTRAPSPFPVSSAVPNAFEIDSAFADEILTPELIVRRKARRRQTLNMIALFYAVEAIILISFASIGTTSFLVSPGFLLCGYLAAAVAAVASETGYSDRLRDHYMTPAIAGSNVVIQVAFLYFAPETAVVFVCALFMVFGYATLNIAMRYAVLVWVITSLGLAGVLLFTDKQLAFPVSTPAERALTMLTICFSIGGFIYVSLFGVKFRRKLYERSNELKHAYRRIEELAEIDELTGAYNRRRMMRALEEECERVARSNEPFSVALIDLDHFKRINDRYGHPVGDEVLRTFAITMFANIRGVDRFGRYGGEEFLLLMPDTACETAALILDRLRVIVADLDWSAYSCDLSVTISAGVAAWRPGEAPDALLTRADAALYRAKDQGRNLISIA